MLRPQLRPCRCDEQRPSNRCPILSTYFQRLCPDRFRCCSNKYACQRRGAEILRQSCDDPFHSSTDSFLTMLTTFDRAISRCDGERAMSEGSLSRSYDPYVGHRPRDFLEVLRLAAAQQPPKCVKVERSIRIRDSRGRLQPAKPKPCY